VSWTVAVVVVAAYLVGSIDFAVLVARAKGLDIYDLGSGNPGTANVARNLGWKAAAPVLVGDVLKGVVASAVGLWVGTPALAVGAGLAAVLGHCFPIWHRFKGGKGVATAGGAIIVVSPILGVALVVIWATVARLIRISSVASLTVVVLSVPGLAIAGHRGWVLIWAGAMAVLVLARHSSNISRLRRGKENSLGAGSGQPGAALE
jgi:glycerol-3-phosphate acyltransferase PlsY